MDRCKFILKTFIFEGEVQTGSIHSNVARARERLDELAKQPDLLKTKLTRKMTSEIQKALKGKWV